MDEQRGYTRAVAGFETGRVLKILVRKLWAVLLAAVLTAGALVGLGWSLPPEYEATVVFYVSAADLSPQDTDLGEDLVDPILVILDTRQTLTEIMGDLGGTGSLEDLGRMIQAKAVNDTQLLEVAVRADDPNAAARIARSLEKILPQRVGALMEGVTMTVADPVRLPERPEDPGYLKLGILGFLLGMTLSAGVVTLGAVLDRKLRWAEDVGTLCSYPVLEEIPGTHPGEICRRLALKIRCLTGEGSRVLAVSGTPALCQGLGEAVTRLGHKCRVVTAEEPAEPEKLREEGDLVILNLEAPGSGTCLDQARRADGVVLSVVRNRTERKTLGDALAQLEFVRARVLGIVITE